MRKCLSEIFKIVSKMYNFEAVEKTNDSEFGCETRHAKVEQTGTSDNIIGKFGPSSG